jgi:hypothetical protein
MRLFGPSHGLALAVAFALAAPAAAQSLGEVAARNKEKEKKGNAKVYTEADLHGGKGGTVSQPGDPLATTAVADPAAKKADGTAPAGAAEKPKTEEELKAEAQKAWQDKKAKAEADVARLNGEVTRLQTALGDLSGPLYGGSRTAQLNQMEAAKKQLAAAQTTLADITEEGRRAGYR